MMTWLLYTVCHKNCASVSRGDTRILLFLGIHFSFDSVSWYRTFSYEKYNIGANKMLFYLRCTIQNNTKNLTLLCSKEHYFTKTKENFSWLILGLFRMPFHVLAQSTSVGAQRSRQIDTSIYSVRTRRRFQLPSPPIVLILSACYPTCYPSVGDRAPPLEEFATWPVA